MATSQSGGDPVGTKRKRTSAGGAARSVGRAMVQALPENVKFWLRRYRNRSRPLPMMSIGLMYGATPWTLAEAQGATNPIVTAEMVSDANAAFVADPFALHRGGVWHLFFELMSRESGKGEIGYATSRDLAQWDYQRIVLAEPFHLSYPGLYVDGDQVWMVPETWESGQVRLYRADAFPYRWRLERVLIEGAAGTDPTLYRTEHGGWAMLLCSADRTHNETLLRYVAPAITGPWREAPDSPLITQDASSARPGGHCFTHEGQLHRLGQDCAVRYGERLRSYLMTSPGEGGVDVLVPSGRDWRSRGGHHADIHMLPNGGLLAFVDGEA